ncbi:MAG: CocE/NonD family hydrolase C-terminal non-catalytic domain-containing protein [Bacillota bacterium]|nr:CocE/NonD family hydrolase C-terminal non-catalytic domain-containing protein [Bacillota bacterium]
MTPYGVRAFITGEGGGWREVDAWPPTGPELRLYLSAGGANENTGGPGTCGDLRMGSLLPTPAGAGTWLEYEYGPADQSPLLERRDGLAFATPPLSVELTVASSAPSTDFAVRIMDVAPDGQWRIIQDGLWRVDFPQTRPKSQPRGRPHVGVRPASGPAACARGRLVAADDGAAVRAAMIVTAAEC